MVTTRVKYSLLRQELLFSLRNADLITIGNRGVATTTATFSGDGSTLNFDISVATVKNVRSVVVSSVTKTFVTHYTVDTNYTGGKCRISFTAGNAPALASSNIVVTYDYGASDRIFSDFPKPYIQQKDDFPRIGFDITNERSADVALGGGAIRNELEVTFIAYAENDRDVDDLLYSLRDHLMQRQKSFLRFKYITPSATGPLLPRDGLKDMIFWRNSVWTIIVDVEE